MKLTEKQIQKFLFSVFAFSDDEIAAMGKQIPMTQEIFNSCMDKCMQAGEAADIDFDYLIEEFPEMADRYMERFLEGESGNLGIDLLRKDVIKYKVYEK